MVVAGPLDGALTWCSTRATWRLDPSVFDLIPLGLGHDELVSDHRARRARRPAFAKLLTIFDSDGHDRDPVACGHLGAPARVVVARGPPRTVDVVDEGGSSGFERSKKRELIAWLTTHRGRSTRTLARTSLWTSTFATRRSRSRLRGPPGDGPTRRTGARRGVAGPHAHHGSPLHDRSAPTPTRRTSFGDGMEARPTPRSSCCAPPSRWSGHALRGHQLSVARRRGHHSNLVLLATSAASELARHHLTLGQIDGVFWATDRVAGVARP